VAREVGRARAVAYRRGIGGNRRATRPKKAEILRLEYRALLFARGGAIPMAALPPASSRPIRCGGAPSAPARLSILKLRQSEDIGDDAFHQLEEEFDWAELSAQG